MKHANDNSLIDTPKIILAVLAVTMGVAILLGVLAGLYVFFKGV